MSVSLITGITGQDGSYLAELLLEEGKQVIGATRNSDTAELLPSLQDHVKLVQIDLTDDASIDKIFAENDIDEVYNLAAYSSGEGMFAHPLEIGEINGLGVVRILEGIRKINPAIRFCQASSSEMFGNTEVSPQIEKTAFHPRTPYGAAKLYAHSMINIYRQRYGIFACSAILFNHESPRRGLNFVTRKVVHAVAAIKMGQADELTLGALDARRDWGYAKDYVQAMRLMLTHDCPDDYVVATGITHSIRDLCECAFGHVDLDYRDYVSVKSDESRVSESVQLVGDASRARKLLGWKAETDFLDLIKMMVDYELEQLNSKF